ncbi:MAG TPA: metallophosphoesterase, partial [Phycisphaerae bacterium]|nr:metallophosphoesterase [Phycisphaerae bacterium]
TVTLFSTGDMHEASGNLVRVAGYVKEWKKKNPGTLLIDAGDFMNDRDPTRGSTPGEQMIPIMIAAGYDVCTLGNHDYKFGKDWMLEMSRKYPKFPLVLCNMNWSQQDKEKAKHIPRYKIFELEGVRVAVIGSGSNKTNHQHGPPFPLFDVREGYLAVYDEVRQKADVIVAVTHQEDGEDRRRLGAWGEKPPDVLIGAHSHNRFAQRSGKTLIIKAGAMGSPLGMVTIKWNTKEKKLVSCTGSLAAVRGDWPEDEEVKALREKFLNPAPKQEQPKKDEKAAQPAGKQASRLAPMAMPVAMLATGLLWWFSSGYRCRRNADR